MRPPLVRPYTNKVIQPTPFLSLGFLLKPTPYLSKENCVRRDIMKQVSTIPVNTKMLPLQDPNEFRKLHAGFAPKQPRPKLPPKKVFNQCVLVHQYE